MNGRGPFYLKHRSHAYNDDEESLMLGNAHAKRSRTFDPVTGVRDDIAIHFP
jgi:hypothetical protein